MAPRDIVTTARPTSLDDVHTLLERAAALGGYTPSPADWRDEVLYFLLPDRFSDGREATRELLTMTRRAALRTTPARPDIDWREWAASGARWQGGTIAGIRGRLDYLQGLGVTTLWIGPVFKQRARLDTFHGYGVQDFLEVDPRFGSRADLADLCEDAHARGLRVILDIIANHTGDNWGYVAPDAGLDGLRNEPPYLAFPQFYGAADGAGEGWTTALRDEHQQGSTTAPGDPRRRLADRAARAAALHARRRRLARRRRARRRARRAQAHRLLRAQGSGARRRRDAARPWSTATSTGSRSATATASVSTPSSTCRSRRRATSAAPCASSPIASASATS